MTREAKLKIIELAAKNCLEGSVRIKPDQLPDEILMDHGYVPKSEITKEEMDETASITVSIISDAKFIEVDEKQEKVKVKIERSAILKPGTECWVNLDDVVSINL